MERDTYIKRVLTVHLLDKNTYKQLTEDMAKYKLNELQEQLTKIFENPSANVQNSLSKMEKKYFAKSLQDKHRIPTFYGLVKIQKQPWTLRPVVSCCGSLLVTISTWIDVHLQKIRNKLPAFIKDSDKFQHELSKIKIPHNTKIFTCDAVSMYMNIDIDHSIEIVRRWFTEFNGEIPNNISTDLII